jgi:hypothetical protein
VLLLLFLACRDYAALCADDDPSVTTSKCWNRGDVDGYNAGYADAYQSAFDTAAAACGDAD